MSYTLETKERSTSELLKTHYYKTSYEKLKTAFLNIIPKYGFTITDINDTYGEILLDSNTMSITAKIEMQTMTETSIDFFITGEEFLGKMKAKAFLKNIYEELGKCLEFKGLSLHR